MSYFATASVAAIGLLLMMVGQDTAWILCLGTVAVLLGSTFALKKIDVRRPRPSVVTSPAQRRIARRMIVIVGAGLAGLSTAYHLSGHRIGSMNVKRRWEGFADPTARMDSHSITPVTCFRQPDIKSLIERLLAGNSTHRRKSFIYSRRPIPNIRSR